MCTVGFLLHCASVPRACLKILLEWKHLGTDSGSPSSARREAGWVWAEMPRRCSGTYLGVFLEQNEGGETPPPIHTANSYYLLGISLSQTDSLSGLVTTIS